MKAAFIRGKQIFSVYQKKLLRWAAIFVVIFTLCALISRGIYSMGMPLVTMGNAKMMKLNHTISADGTIVGGLEVAVAAEPNLLISSVLVESGQQVEPGTPLVRLDMAYLANKIEMQQTEIAKQEIQLQALADTEAFNQEKQSTALERAQQDYTNAQNDAAAAEGSAQENLDKALHAMNELGSREDYIRSRMESNQEYQKLKRQKEDLERQAGIGTGKGDAAKKRQQREALAAAKKALSNFQTSLEATLGSEWEANKKQFDTEISAGEQALDELQRTGDANLQTAARAIEDASAGVASDGGREVAETELGMLKKQLARYQQLKKAGGVIKAVKKGDIIHMNVKAGDLTMESALLTMTDQKEGYRFKAEISKDQKKFVELNDQGKVRLNDNTNVDITIDAVEENAETENYLISGSLDSKVALGDMGTLELVKNNDKEQLCVPLSSLRGSDTDIYVLVAEGRETIMGEQLTAVKYPVKMIDKNDQIAAVDAVLTEEMQLIDSATKLVNEGDTVRLQKKSAEESE